MLRSTAPRPGPTMPTGLSGSATTGGVLWSWDASADEHDGSIAASGVKEYDIEADGVVTVQAAVSSNILALPTVSSIGGAPMTMTQSGNVRTLVTSGTGIDGTADQCGFVSWPVIGDFKLTCKVASFSGVGAFEYAPAGLMVRDSTAAGSRYVALYQWFSALNMGWQSKWRETTDGPRQSGQFVAGDNGAVWLQIERSSDTFVFRWSRDSTDWTVLETKTMAMNVGVNVGAFSSDLQASPVTVTAVIDQLSYTVGSRLSYTQTTVAPSASVRVRARDLGLTPAVSVYSPLLTRSGPLSGFSWNPGFYVFNQQIAYPASGSGSATDGYTDADLDEIAAMASAKGWSQYTTWGKLEGSRGDYTAGFAWLDSLLAKCAARGRRLCITIVGSSYGGLYRYPDTYPSYITTESGAAGGIYLKEAPYSGVTIKWWNAAVMDRFIAMLQAYAARYNDSPYFEGVHLMWETDLGFDPSSVSTDYSDGAYETQLTRMISSAAAAFTRKNVWLRSNSTRLPSTMETLIAACYTYGVGVGGPDIYPQMAALDGFTKRELTWADEVMRGYRWNGSAHVPGGTDYRGLISRGTHAEAPAWSSWNSNSYGPFSPQNMYDQAFTNHQSHIFFLKKTWAEGTGNETFWDTGTYPQIKTWLNVTAPGVAIRSGFPTRYSELGRSPVTGGT